MATLPQLFILIAIFLSTTIVVGMEDLSASSIPPSSLLQQHAYPSSLFAPVLTNLGFQELAAAAASLSTTTWRGPITIFAPTDSSLLTCPSCSVPLILQEHAIPGLYPLRFLRTLASGTKIETLAPGRCITTMSDADASQIFVSGVEITRPDLYNDGLVVVHGLQGFISQLSPFSCSVDRMTSLSFPPPPPMAPFFVMRMMLRDAFLRLQISGYVAVTLALRLKHAKLLNLHAMTVFAVDDSCIFSGGQEYISDWRFHIVPNRLLTAADLERLPAATALPTMERGEKLVVTTAGRGGPLGPMRINYVNIRTPDLIHNLKIVVHGLSMAFPHIHRTAATDFSQIEGSGWKAEGSGYAESRGINGIMGPTYGIKSTAGIEDHHGL